MIQTRKCSRCGKVKPLTKFPVERRSKKGRRRYCYACRSRDEGMTRQRRIELGIDYGEQIQAAVNREGREKRIPAYAEAVARGEPIP